MMPRRTPKPKPTLSFAVNRMRIKVPLLFEIEGDGLIPAIGTLGPLPDYSRLLRLPLTTV
jgi:hypothetical protein